MKKLNKAEINALTNKIYQELSSPYKVKHNAEMEEWRAKVDEIESEAVKDMDALKEKYPTLKGEYHCTYVLNRMKDHLTRDVEAPPRMEIPFNSGDIEQKVILAQMEIKTVNELIDAVKNELLSTAE